MKTPMSPIRLPAFAVATASLLSMPLLLIGCGGGSSGSSSEEVGSDDNTTLTGQAVKGPLDSATITAYALNADGTRGEFLGSTTTDASGNYALSVAHAGPVEVVATGGLYYDEASGLQVTLPDGFELRTLVASLRDSSNVAVTALTTIAARHASANASVGLETAIAAANSAVEMAFGIPDIDITSTRPADMTSLDAVQDSDASQRYGLIQAGLTQLADIQGVAPETVLTLVEELAEDFSDGQFDGKNAAGESLSFSFTITPQEAITGLNTAMSAFLAGPANAAGDAIPEILIPIPRNPPVAGSAF